MHSGFPQYSSRFPRLPYHFHVQLAVAWDLFTLIRDQQNGIFRLEILDSEILPLFANFCLINYTVCSTKVSSFAFLYDFLPNSEILTILFLSTFGHFFHSKSFFHPADLAILYFLVSLRVDHRSVGVDFDVIKKTNRTRGNFLQIRCFWCTLTFTLSYPSLHHQWRVFECVWSLVCPP